MPRAFDSQPLPNDRDPLRNILGGMPKQPPVDFAAMQQAAVTWFNTMVGDLLDAPGWADAKAKWDQILNQVGALFTLVDGGPVSAAQWAVWWSNTLIALGVDNQTAATVANWLSGNYDAAKSAKAYWDNVLTQINALWTLVHAGPVSAAQWAVWWSNFLIALGVGTTDAATIANFLSGNYDAAKQAKAWMDQILTSLEFSSGTQVGEQIAALVTGLNDAIRTGDWTPLLQTLFGTTTVGSTVQPSAIPGLDASKITSGTFAQSMISGLSSTLSALLGANTFQALLDSVANALGHSGTGYTINQIGSYLGLIPAGNVTGTLGPSQIPGLDASKITSGSFAQSMVSGLGSTLSALLGQSTFQSLLDSVANALGHAGTGYTITQIGSYLGVIPAGNVSGTLSAGQVPALDASKITSGSFAQSMISGLGSTLSSLLGQSTFQQLLDSVSNALGQSGTGHTITQIGQYLGLIPATNLAGTLAAGSIPGLDASKITSGSFSQTRVSGLTSVWNDLFGTPTPGSGQTILQSAITDLTATWNNLFGTGNSPKTSPVAAGVVPALPASKITSGSFLSSLIPALDASKVTSGQLGTAQVPALPASQITSGLFGQSLIPSLGSGWGGSIASSLLNGAVALGLIPALPASQVTSGTFGSGLIPSIDASKVSTGIFGQGQIPSLGSGWGGSLASSLLSGAVALGLIPPLPGSQITSGTVPAAVVPALDASKITSGVLGAGVIPNITTAMSTDLADAAAVADTAQALGQNAIDGINQAVTGGAATGVPDSTIVPNLTNIPINNITPPPNPSTSGAVSFDSAGSWTAQTPNASTATLTGTHTINGNYLIIDVLIAASEIERYPAITCGGQIVNPYYQNRNTAGTLVTYVLPNPPKGAQNIVITTASNQTGTVYVLAAQSKSYFGVVKIKKYTVDASTNSNPSMSLLAGLNNMVTQCFAASNGVGNNTALSAYNKTSRGNSGNVYNSSPNRSYALLSGDAAGTGSNMTFTATCANSGSFQAWLGIAVELQGAGGDVLGSCFRRSRTSTGTVSGSAGLNKFLASFMNAVEIITPDWSYNASTGVLTCLNAGTYRFTVSVIEAAIGTPHNIRAAIFFNNAIGRQGTTVPVTSTATGTYLASVTAGRYCVPGDTVEAGYWLSVAVNAVFTGEATGSCTYFEAALENRGYHS